MSRQVPRDKPLSDEDRSYLESRGQDDLAKMIDEQHGKDGEVRRDADVVVEDDDEDNYDDTKAWPYPALQEELKRRNLSAVGSRPDLIERLRADDSDV